jgi:hypothetical protein
VVVPILEGVQIGIQLFEFGDHPLTQLVFQCAEQAFDSAVLPRTSRRGELVANAEFLQSFAKCFRGEDSFVVGANGLWFGLSP